MPEKQMLFHALIEILIRGVNLEKCYPYTLFDRTEHSRQNLSLLICLEEAQSKLQGTLNRDSHRLFSLTSLEGPEHSAKGLG